ncbi:Arginine decarboxylase [Spatholobus suberectus]|nr:Arginine decarboxylase [Spatholobus suberectus]
MSAGGGASPALSEHYLAEELSEDHRILSDAVLRGDYETCLLYTEEMKQRCVEQFKQGAVCMEQLAAVEGLCELVRKAVGAGEAVFPIIPIHRLDEKPSVRGILSDLTCDSDGKIDKFINGESSLPLHEMEGGSYYLGMFLGGAYEEALGGLHNLFGGPSVVRVSQSDGPHSFAVTRAVPGPSCGDVLRVMQHQPELMFETLKHRAHEYVTHDNAAAVLASGLARTFDRIALSAAAVFL